MSLPAGVVAEASAAPFPLRQIRMTVFTGSGCVSVFSVTALSTAPGADFVAPREADRSEHSAALVANLPRKDPVLREQVIALPDCEQHCYSSPSRGCVRSRQIVAFDSFGASRKRKLSMLNAAGTAPILPSRFLST